MVITRQYAVKNNIKLQEGLQYNRKNKPQNDDLHYIFKFLLFIMIFTMIFTITTITYYYLLENDNTSFSNFIITDLPEKTIVKLYNKIPARPYNYILDWIQDYNINFF